MHYEGSNVYDTSIMLGEPCLAISHGYPKYIRYIVTLQYYNVLKIPVFNCYQKYALKHFPHSTAYMYPTDYIVWRYNSFSRRV